MRMIFICCMCKVDIWFYVIYYVVISNGRNKKIMEVRRILHGLQDRGKAL